MHLISEYYLTQVGVLAAALLTKTTIAYMCSVDLLHIEWHHVSLGGELQASAPRCHLLPLYSPDYNACSHGTVSRLQRYKRD